MQKFREKVVLLTDGLNKIDGFNTLDPTATFYVFPNVAPVCNELGITSHGLALYLLEGADDKFGVACLGGECFGEAGAGFLRFSLRRTERAIAAGARLHPEGDCAQGSSRGLARAEPAPPAREALRRRVTARDSTRFTHCYVKPVTAFTGRSAVADGYCRQVSEILAPDGFPLNSPGLAPGFFLPARDGGHSRNARSNFLWRPWMADMPQTQERFAAARPPTARLPGALSHAASPARTRARARARRRRGRGGRRSADRRAGLPARTRTAR